MSLPAEERPSPGPVNDRLIDRLVDGELPEVERRELLRRLDTEPDGWRRCALAFLEGQNWREAFVPLVVAARERPAAERLPEGPARRPKRWRLIARWTGLAAGLALAFALGWAVHGGPADTSPQVPVAKGEMPVLPRPSEPTLPPVDVAPRESPPSKPADVHRTLDQVVKQWEQRGYRAETQQRLVSVELKDGRKAAVPVHEVRLRYVGNRTY